MKTNKYLVSVYWLITLSFMACKGNKTQVQTNPQPLMEQHTDSLKMIIDSIRANHQR